MFKKSFYKHWYILPISLLLNCFFVGSALAHGDIPMMIMYGRYFFVVGIVTACVFSALSRKHPIISSIAGMFLGIFIGTFPLLFWAGLLLYWEFLSLFLTIGLLIYFVPATLIGIAIGFLFKRLKRKNSPTIDA